MTLAMSLMPPELERRRARYVTHPITSPKATAPVVNRSMAGLGDKPATMQRWPWAKAGGYRVPHMRQGCKEKPGQALGFWGQARQTSQFRSSQRFGAMSI